MINLPTKITVLRILLTPIIFYLIFNHNQSIRDNFNQSPYLYLLLVTFSIAMITDALDGYVSRRLNLISRIGTFLDPIADKILIFSTSAALTFIDCGNPLPIYYTTFIFAREIIQISGAIAIGSIAGDIEVKHHIIGKVSTMMQVIIIYGSLLLRSESVIFYFSVLTSFFSICAAILYIYNGLIQLPNNPNAVPTKQ